ncbi:hypothetical protein BCR41DRAFT_374115 [Lobosporangium transversale]|uniref:Uncharacterized protein n=1 Tax=Lobosporangium transversale TaxID=64571 RepID=A0A1Y2GBW8_9FUNG|nr:hypothetical protein BCR41DRAFT_374115 [Lobosporangium transversale]ORZ06392.1 hypothetical protein BCR41DRAFT_374115 [Lobosporangium transversale]|eukprot:XP_021877555.1 hypothetical protein BCR41DRAFT_374115 [Lobosporangium transversale]
MNCWRDIHWKPVKDEKSSPRCPRLDHQRVQHCERRKKRVLELKLQASYGEDLTLVEDDFYNQLYIFMRIKKNLSLNGFMQQFIQHMVDAGCFVQGIQGHVAKNH